ncbi:helix-turn-helix transcriptional regulator [Streptomyces sp. NBC_01433]|uniref:helix-turn-helix domain-containing protein n=1 Tax=Streptomyces sp. NBC_01433 TaxID=2903864 RepID=UPI00224D5314|nr:helix-turn-helix transcriptional regulator [Streptomyces sp. NBC_01433]MCX4676622.1 helix-turn-helix transcriptional regulator [Streptomyces sp. NBC_01433]
MPVSPSSSAQAAREALAARLGDLRLGAGLTGRELASRAGWSAAKASRIGNAKTTPSDADIRAWCVACDAADQTADLIAANRSTDSMYVDWRRKQRTGLRRLQESAVPLFERTRRFRVYCSNVVPGLVQTEGYARALLTSITEFRRIPHDVDQAVEARMARSRVIREGDHRFALIIEEDVLHYGFGDAGVMAGQLGYLLAVMSLPSVSLGIIPRTTPRRMWPMETFMVFDDERAAVELLSADVTVTTPSEVALYVRAFGELSGMAVYGGRARALVTEAITSLG